MAGLIKHEKTESNPEVQKVAALLGGARILGRSLKGPLDAHEVLLRGLPGKALIHLIDSLVVLLPFGMKSRPDQVSQKSSLPQPTQSVSWELTANRR